MLERWRCVQPLPVANSAAQKGSRFGRTAEGGKKEGGGGLLALGACTVQPPSAARLVGTTSPGIFARWRRMLCLAAFTAAEHTVNMSCSELTPQRWRRQGARTFEASSIGTRCAVCTENHAAHLSSRSGAQPLQGLRRQRPLRARAAAPPMQGVRRQPTRNHPSRGDGGRS